MTDDPERPAGAVFGPVRAARVFVVRSVGPLSAEVVGALLRSTTVVASADELGDAGGWLAPRHVRVDAPPGLEARLAAVETALAAGASAVTTWDPTGAGDGLLQALAERKVPHRVVGEPGAALPGTVVPEPPDPAWSERHPLLGWTVVVTRPPDRADDLADRLSRRGARVLAAPAIVTAPPDDPGPLQRAVRRIDTYDWVLFTSARAVAACREALSDAGLDPARALDRPRVAAIGDATAGALDALGVRPDLVPPRFVAESLLQALAAVERWDGKRVLLPRAARGRDVVPDGLEALGASVDVVVAYQTVPAGNLEQVLGRGLRGGDVDLVTFTSSSIVEAFRDGPGDLGRAAAVAIGPVTARSVREAGFPLAAVASEHTATGLALACEAVARSERG